MLLSENRIIRSSAWDGQVSLISLQDILRPAWEKSSLEHPNATFRLVLRYTSHQIARIL
jgi:hypothetical protein